MESRDRREQLRLDVARLAELRRKLAEKQDEWRTLVTMFEQHHAERKEAIAELKTAVAELETRIREAAVSEYELTGDRTPAPGIAIRLVTRVEYDPKEALRWAVEKRLAVTLDRAAFEKIAVASKGEGVPARIREVPQATIATDLDKALSVAELLYGSPETSESKEDV
ncbi:MAG: hypothetical protein KatS3mg109_0402 [Pirellulaceae bacterium]|nr:MAG: hypothetical protein KatS3mg109_0402 [Pirellulaceae bacterium]